MVQKASDIIDSSIEQIVKGRIYPAWLMAIWLSMVVIANIDLITKVSPNLNAVIDGAFFIAYLLVVVYTVKAFWRKRWFWTVVAAIIGTALVAGLLFPPGIALLS